MTGDALSIICRPIEADPQLKDSAVETNRRKLWLGVGFLGAAALLFASPLQWTPISQAHAQTISAAELMAPGALPDHAMGNSDAPVTVIEYASLTCPHCANFATTTFPELKKRYIDTGKVRFIYRDFPLDQLAAAGSMLARCVPGDKYFDVIEALFQQQSKWAVNKPLPPLLAIAKQVGFTQQSFEACLSNQKLLDDLQKDRDRAAKQFGVNSTPTFFINGKLHRGGMTIDEMEKAIDSHIKS
jgi:protein-disulfide isomerase